MFEIAIVADTNDADYVAVVRDITQDQLNEILPVIDAIREYSKANPYAMNWPAMWDDPSTTIEDAYPDLPEDLINKFQNFLPSFEGGIHSIESIEYYLKPKKIKLL